MPQRMWKHRCGDTRTAFSMGSPACRSCGGRGEYEGWRYTMHEAMARYQSQYRLRPLGPHRGMADKLLEGTTIECERCWGRGLRGVPGDGWQTCLACGGFGSTWAVAEDEIQRLRQRILDAYPDAEAQPIPDFAGAPLALDLGTRQVVRLSRQRPPSAIRRTRARYGPRDAR